MPDVLDMVKQVRDVVPQVPVLAERLGASERQVYRWLARQSRPRNRAQVSQIERAYLDLVSPQNG